MSSDIVVWEWQEDNGLFFAYEPKTSNEIEKASNSHSTVSVDVRHMRYVIDPNTQQQTNRDTGMTRQIRRSVLPCTSAFARGLKWEWQDHRPWRPYATELVDEIDEAHQRGDNTLNLSLKHADMPYEIDFRNMTQVNIQTHYWRSIRTQHLSGSYASNVTTLPSSVPSPSSSLSKSAQSFAGPSQASVAPQSGSVIGASSQPMRRKSVAWKDCPHGGISSSANGQTQNVSVSEAMSLHTQKVENGSTEVCAVCQNNLDQQSGFGNGTDVVELNKCKHTFHLECIVATYSHGVKGGCIVCPYCNTLHGIKTGDQPAGTMTYSRSHYSLPGYQGHGTIEIQYNIPSGTQYSEHPHPGQQFTTPGFPRRAYLPDSDEGRSILFLLVEAWKRRLIFTVGRSTTTGADNVVTWSSVHHKTSNNSHGSHGYPDPTYLERVRSELETVGVSDDWQ